MKSLERHVVPLKGGGYSLRLFPSSKADFSEYLDVKKLLLELVDQFSPAEWIKSENLTEDERIMATEYQLFEYLIDALKSKNIAPEDVECVTALLQRTLFIISHDEMMTLYEKANTTTATCIEKSRADIAGLSRGGRVSRDEASGFVGVGVILPSLS